MWKPVPIKKSDIEVGLKCVMVQVSPENKLLFDKFAFAGRPVKKDTQYYVRTYKPQKRTPQSWLPLTSHHISIRKAIAQARQEYQEKQKEMDFSSRNLTFLGIILEKRIGWYGRYNRTFKATPATIKFFEKFNQKENVLPAWLEFIGITDPIDDVGACIDEAHNA
jgi:hypothetical protein